VDYSVECPSSALRRSDRRRLIVGNMHDKMIDRQPGERRDSANASAEKDTMTATGRILKLPTIRTLFARVFKQRYLYHGRPRLDGRQ